MPRPHEALRARLSFNARRVGRAPKTIVCWSGAPRLNLLISDLNQCSSQGASSAPEPTVSSSGNPSEPAKRPVTTTLRYPRSVEALYLRPLRRETEYGIPSCDLQLRSYGVRGLEFFSDFALRAAYYLNLPAFGPVPLPRITERWTVPRSNFIFKKSQENFERITLRRLIQIRDGNPETVQVWLAFLQKHAYSGVGMKANMWEFSKPGQSHAPSSLPHCLTSEDWDLTNAIDRYEPGDEGQRGAGDEGVGGKLGAFGPEAPCRLAGGDRGAAEGRAVADNGFLICLRTSPQGKPASIRLVISAGDHIECRMRVVLWKRFRAHLASVVKSASFRRVRWRLRPFRENTR